MLALEAGSTYRAATLPTMRGASTFFRAFAFLRLITSNLIAAALLTVGVTAPAAQTITVTTTADNVATPPTGSLRKAIADAVDGDTIEFQAGLTGTIGLAGSELLLDKSLTIVGPGAAALAISGNQQSRVFRIPAGKTVAISGLTIRDGKAADGADADTGAGGTGEAGPGESGGGVFNEGVLTITACQLTNNAAGVGGAQSGFELNSGEGGSGGAVFSSGTLTLIECTLTANRAGVGGAKPYATGSSGKGGSGGAIHVSAGQFELQRCTVGQNGSGARGLGNLNSQWGTSGDGGGISIQGGTALLKNSSVVRNLAGMAADGPYSSSGGDGGGISIGLATVTFHTCTIGGNQAGNVTPWAQYVRAGDGGGIVCEGGIVNLISCTVSDNIAGDNGGDRYPYPGFAGPFPDGLGGGIHVASGTVTVRNTIISGNRQTPTNPVNSDPPSIPNVSGAIVNEGHNFIGGDSQLGVLADYGGPTPTYALRPGSAAIDAGDDSITGSDQRGNPRLVGAHVDIGAFERDPSQTAIVSFESQNSQLFEGASSAAIAVQRSGDTTTAAAIEFSTSGGTAVAGMDYVPTSGMLEFAPGQTEGVIHIALLDDEAVDDLKTIEITLGSSNSSSVIYPLGTHTVTVRDEDAGVFRFATTTSTVSENDGNVQIAVLRTGGSVGTVSVTCYTSSRSAGSGDYVGSNQVLTFEAGVTEKTITIPIKADSFDEGDETFVVQLAVPYPYGGAPVGEPSSHEVTILDDYNPAILNFETTISVVSEGAGSAIVRVLRSGNTDQSVSVSFATIGGAATSGSDYTPISGTLNFGPGITQQTIVVPINDDAVFEEDEWFWVTLGNAVGYAILGSSKTNTVSIESDDDGPGVLSFASNSTSISEGGGIAVVTVVREGGSIGTVSVSYATSSLLAVSGSDFAPTTGTLTFGPGVTQQTITVPIVNDSELENDESFTIELTNPTDGALLNYLRRFHTVSIVNDDSPATIEFAASSTSIAEGAGQAVVTIVRSGNTSSSASVQVSASNGSAASGSDYSFQPSTVTFAPGVSEQTVAVSIVDDSVGEGSEQFDLVLSNPGGGANLGGQTTHTVTILGNDAAAVIAFATMASSAAEASGSTIVTLIRSGNTATTATVQISAVDGTAFNGREYSFVTRTVTFDPGVTEQTVTVVLIDDSFTEAVDSFSLMLSNPGGGAILGSQISHMISMLDGADDTEPLHTIRKGRYRGLVTAPEDQTPEYAMIVLNTTDSRMLTGTLRLRGKTLRIKGRFSEEGAFSQEFSQRSLGSLKGSSLELQSSQGILGGTFQLPGGAVLGIEARREVSGTRDEPVAEANSYTAILQTQLPGNAAGFLRTRVLPTGRITLSGKLPDGTRLSSSSHLTEFQSFPVCFPIYSKQAGHLAGTARFVLADPLPFTGDLHWRKPANSGPPYAEGFAEESVEVIGNVYTQSRRQRILDDFDTTQGSAFFQTSTAANPTPVALNAMWNQNNTIRILLPEFSRSPMRVTLQPKTGLFTGTFRDAENQPRKFFGICIQRPQPGEDVASGFFLDGETSGRVEIVPQN